MLHDYKTLPAEPIEGEGEIQVKKDNRTKALIAINVFAVSYVTASIIFKKVEDPRPDFGVSVIDYQLFSFLTLLSLTVILLTF